MGVASEEIPVIDIAPFLSGSAGGKETVAAHVKRACEDIGFFSIVGHGVPDAQIENMRAVSNRFFDLPLEEKLKVRRAPGAGSPGYGVLGEIGLGRSLGAKTPPDYQEGFVIGPRVRATRSVEPPGGYGTTIVIARSG